MAGTVDSHPFFTHQGTKLARQWWMSFRVWAKQLGSLPSCEKWGKSGRITACYCVWYAGGKTYWRELCRLIPWWCWYSCAFQVGLAFSRQCLVHGFAMGWGMVAGNFYQLEKKPWLAQDGWWKTVRAPGKLSRLSCGNQEYKQKLRSICHKAWWVGLCGCGPGPWYRQFAHNRHSCGNPYPERDQSQWQLPFAAQGYG